MQYFPVYLNIEGRRCLVIGGGSVATRKVQALLECGAVVEVVSPDVTAELKTILAAGKITWVARAYQPGDLSEAFLVIAATDDSEVQAGIFAEAEEKNILLNVADVPRWCNFILPATVRRGDLSFAVSTGGKSPALARNLRQNLEKIYGPEYGVLVDILGELRDMVISQGKSSAENKILFGKLASLEIVDWIKNGEWQRISRHFSDILGGNIELKGLGGAEKHDTSFSGGSSLK